MTSQDALVASLHNWRLQQMNYTSQRPGIEPSAENLRQLCCGQLSDVWRYIVDHVVDIEHAHNVRGNLELHADQCSDESLAEEERLQKELDDGEKMLKEVETEVETLENSLETLTADIAGKGRSLWELNQVGRIRQRQSVVYSALKHSTLTQEERVLHSVQHLHSLLPHHPADEHNNVAACMSDMKSCLSQLSQSVTASTSSTAHMDEVFGGAAVVAAMVAPYRPHHLRQCFISEQQQAVTSLQTLLQQCRESCSSHEQLVLSSLHSCIDQLNSRHIGWSCEALSARRQCRHLYQQLQDTLALQCVEGAKVQLSDALLIEARDHAQRHLQDRVSQLLIDVAEKPASLQPTQRVSSQYRRLSSLLNNTMSRSEAACSQASHTLAECHRRLTAQHSSTSSSSPPPGRLADCLKQVCEEEQRYSLEIGSHVKKHATHCGGGGEEEESVTADCSSSEFRQVAALRRWWQQRRCSVRAARDKRLMDTTRTQTDFTAQLNAVRVRVNETMRREQDVTSQQLQQIRTDTVHVRTALSNVDHAITVWRDEPAQCVCNEVTVEGVSYEQWSRRYNSATATSSSTSISSHRR